MRKKTKKRINTGIAMLALLGGLLTYLTPTSTNISDSKWKGPERIIITKQTDKTKKITGINIINAENGKKQLIEGDFKIHRINKNSAAFSQNPEETDKTIQLYYIYEGRDIYSFQLKNIDDEIREIMEDKKRTELLIIKQNKNQKISICHIKRLRENPQGCIKIPSETNIKTAYWSPSQKHTISVENINGTSFTYDTWTKETSTKETKPPTMEKSTIQKTYWSIVGPFLISQNQNINRIFLVPLGTKLTKHSSINFPIVETTTNIHIINASQRRITSIKKPENHPILY